MLVRALILAVVAPLMATSAGPAVPAPGAAAAPTAVGTPRTAQVDVRSGSARLVGTVHVDAGLERIGASLTFQPGSASGTTWGRIWLGVRDGAGGCTKQVVIQGRTKDITDWTVREAGGAAVAVVEEFAPTTATGPLRLQLDRPNLPSACAVPELWTGDASGPTTLLRSGERDLTRAIPDEALTVRFPVKFRVPWGSTTTTPVFVGSSLNAPSAVQGLSVGLAPASQGPVVDADSTPADWDFWADGSTMLDLPITPTQPWGTQVRPTLTTDNGTWPRGTRRLFIRHQRPTDWVGSLAGLRLWRTKVTPGYTELPTWTFLDDEWVYLHRNGRVVKQCTTSTSRWSRGCHRYTYDEATGRLQIGQLRARITPDGWWWQDQAWTRSQQVRSLPRGATRSYQGVGRLQTGRGTVRVELVLRKNGSYRIQRGRELERGQYRALGGSMVRLDPGRRGGVTSTLQLDFFGQLVNNTFTLDRVRLGTTITRPS